MTPADIAAAIRRVSPGALPESFHVLGEDLCFRRSACRSANILAIFDHYQTLPDDIAEAVLIAAMVQDANLARWPGGDWVGNQKAFNDADHGGSLGACYAAWRFAKGIA